MSSTHPLIQFDPVEHRYTRKSDGVVVPSVTQILTLAGMGGYYKGDAGRDRGTRVHAAIQSYAESGLPPFDEIEEDIIHPVEQFMQFMADVSPKIKECERLVYYDRYEYAGIYDLNILLNGESCILDVKTGVSVPKTVGLQTAAYQMADQFGVGGSGEKRKRAFLHLPNSGNYKFRTLDNDKDYSIWIGIVEQFCNQQR